MNHMKKFQAIIVGGGMVGLSCAKGLSDCGIDVAIIEKNIPDLEFENKKSDLRVSAINRASEHLLEDLGVWQAISQMPITAYDQMRVWDENSSGMITMQAGELGERELGFIIENRIIIKALWQSLKESNVIIFAPNYIKSLDKNNQAQWKITLDDDTSIQADLLIGADGARSWLREKLDFKLKQKPYNQHGVVAEIKTDRMHQQTAYQRFLKTGPLAFLPLVKNDHCSIVWSTTPELAKHYLEIDEKSFNDELSKSFEFYLGHCEVQSKRVQFPLVEQHVEDYVKEGVVLIGDAAHVIHPLAGQGVNQGFRDVEVLVNVLKEAHQKGRLLSNLSLLKEYERQRRWHNQLLIWAMQAFKTGFSNQSKILSFIRGKGLNFVDQKKLLKRFFMMQAMGKKGLF